MTKLHLLALAAALVATTPATAEIKYRTGTLLRTGFSDKQVAPDLWSVKGSSKDRDGSVAVALYRAAEIASAANVDTIRIVRQRVRMTTVTNRRNYDVIGYREVADITFRAVRGDADRAACDMPDAKQCLTLPVAGLLSRYGPQIGMPAARPGETPAAPVPITLRSDLADAVAKFAGQRGYTTPADRYPAWHAPAATTPVAVVAQPAPPRFATLPPVAPARIKAVPVDLPATAATLDARLAAAKPVRGREPMQGWTISD